MGSPSSRLREGYTEIGIYPVGAVIIVRETHVIFRPSSFAIQGSFSVPGGQHGPLS